ncbi:MAG: choice-of-anchor Q domain-containing protein, partial [Pirellulales bacterium]
LTTGNLTMDQSTVSGNSTAGSGAPGGGIFTLFGDVMLTQSTVSGNSTTGDFAFGGGIAASGAVTLTQSTVSGNSTSGNSAEGGGIQAGGTVTLIQSSVSGNSTSGESAEGGGIRAQGSMTLTQSTVSGNSTSGNGGDGGGIFSAGTVTLTQSTVSGNNAAANAGGIWAGGSVTLTQSTVSGNSSTGPSASGGGIRTIGAVTLTQSTVTDNHALGLTAMGGGVFQANTGSNHPFSISGSIVAGNTAAGSGADLVKDQDPQSTLTVNYSLIGVTPAGGFVGIGNITGLDPLLGGLVDNGGPTLTHAPLTGSPAIDAGDPNIVFNPAEFDQRGAPFVRVFDGAGADGARIDMGAFERQTLASLNLVVDTAADENDGDYSAGNLSLREAIVLANASPDADTITFAAALSGATITLGGTELAIGEALVIDARPLASNLTIDANELSRIFHIKATTGDFTLGGLTLTGGRTTAASSAGRGGAIHSLTTGNLTMDQSTVSGNSTSGEGAEGGGIRAQGSVTLTESTVSGNSTSGEGAEGGGIRAQGAVTLTQSTVSGNSTAGSLASGGGIFSFGAVTLTESTVSGNSAATIGGGIRADGAVTLTQSTVSGNNSAGSSATGGGGGIWTLGGAVTLSQSTVTDNHALGATALGGGVFQANTPLSNHPFSISGSIVAGNTAVGGGADLVKDPGSTLTINYSLIGTGITPTAGGNNVVTNNPQLGSLADNGGPTMTHELLAGSPAIDAGDPSIVFNPAEYDQRGAPFARVSGGRIDIGAFEVQPIIVPPDLLGDYNQDGSVDAADYVVWRKTLGTTGVVPFSGADGNGDGDITEADYGVWTANFGDALPPPGAGSGGVAHVDSTTGVVESTTTTTAFAEPQDVPPESLNFARSASSHMTRPGLPVANRLAPPQRSQLDLLLATSTAAKTLEDSPAAPLLNPGHPTQDDDSLALDAAFASLADAL